MNKIRLPGCSFCIITDGRREQILRQGIESIRGLNLPKYEIIVVGDVPVLSGSDIQVIQATELAHAGRLGAMRNVACRRAIYDSLVVADDDLLYHSDLADVLVNRGEWDVVCVRVLNPDGSRYWDWATHGGPSGHRLLDYGEIDDFVYVSGSLAIMRAEVHDRVPWDSHLGFYQGEDLDWSSRLRMAGVRIRFDVRGWVTHQDPRYTQKGNIVVFRQDLNQFERLAPGIEVKGVFRHDVGGAKGCKWMAPTAEIRAPARTHDIRKLQFVVSSIIPDLVSRRFAVRVQVNGEFKGEIPFEGVRSVPVSIALRDDLSTVVTLSTDAAVPATTVAIPDERPVSLLIHNATLVNT